MSLYRETYYPDLQTKAYLNHAAVSPLNRGAQKAMQALIERYVVSGSEAWTEGFRYRTEARENIARLIGAEPDQIGMIQNTSTGLMMVAQEFPWQAGDRLVLVEGEFPGNVVPWLVAARENGVVVDWVSPEDVASGSARMLEALRARPKLLAVSWVQYQTGLTQSLVRLCEYRAQFDVQICVDGIQGLGALTMDLAQTPLDYFVCGGHKWLLGPEGTGFIYVRPDRLEAMQPKMVSWLSQDDPISFLFKGPGWVDYQKPFRQNVDRIEMASMSNVLFAGMAESTGIFHQVGPAEVSRKVLALADHARAGLKKAGMPFAENRAEAGIVSIPLEAETLTACVKAMQREGITVGSPDGHLRIAPHFYNQVEEIDAAIGVLKQHRS